MEIIRSGSDRIFDGPEPLTCCYPPGTNAYRKW